MAKTGRYTQARRMLMQAVMALILGATLGLAAFVERQKVASAHVTLGEPVGLLDLTVRLPSDWDSGEKDGVVIAQEPRNHRGRRIITILRLKDEPASVENYLKGRLPASEIHAFEFLGRMGGFAKTPERDLAKPPGGNKPATRRMTLVAAVQAPSGGLVVVKVETPPSLGRTAEILLRDVVQAIEMNEPAVGETRPVIKLRSKPDDEPPQGENHDN